jgi:hypothetical protein
LDIFVIGEDSFQAGFNALSHFTNVQTLFIHKQDLGYVPRATGGGDDSKLLLEITFISKFTKVVLT